jgi:pimeloyl-ACP methyl ester carboxylesterase
MPQAARAAYVPQFPVSRLQRLLIAKHFALEEFPRAVQKRRGMAHSLKHLSIALALLTTMGPSGAQEKYREPVEVIAPNTLSLPAEGREGLLPLYANRGLDTPNPDVDRAVIVIHGRLRNAATYFQSALAALEHSGEAGSHTLLIAPQFLAGIDGARTPLRADILRWDVDSWEGGQDAAGPSPASSFDAMDALLQRLSTLTLFPALRTVVIAGHSAGGQFVQRYAILGRGEELLGQRGVHLRYVIANPSSYVYFEGRRPDDAGHFTPFPEAACPSFNLWKYGMEGLPRYAAEKRPATWEESYIRRDAVYLLGTEDTNPNHRALDKSCMAEAQGAARLSRGEAYFAYLKERHPRDLAHRLVHVPGVGHNGDRMLTSECGMAVLFDRPGCGSS